MKAKNVFDGAEVNFNSKKIALREIGTTNKHAYTNSQIAGHGVVDTSAMTGVNFTLNGHEFAVGDEVIYTAAGAARGKSGGVTLTSGQKYYITATATNTFQISASKGGTAITIPGDASDGSVNDTFYETNNAATGGIFKIKNIHEFNTSQSVTETAKQVTSPGVTAADNLVHMDNHGFVTGDEVTYTSSAAAGGLTTATTYYVVRNDENSFLLATTYANAKASSPSTITISGNGHANDTFTRTSRDSIGVLGLNDLTTSTDWVDEKRATCKNSL